MLWNLLCETKQNNFPDNIKLCIFVSVHHKCTPDVTNFFLLINENYEYYYSTRTFSFIKRKKFKTWYACGVLVFPLCGQAIRCIFISLFSFLVVYLLLFFSEDCLIVCHLRAVIENKINFEINLETVIKHLQSRMTRLRFN